MHNFSFSLVYTFLRALIIGILQYLMLFRSVPQNTVIHTGNCILRNGTEQKKINLNSFNLWIVFTLLNELTENWRMLNNAPVNCNPPPQVRGEIYLPGDPAVPSECGGFVFAPKIAGNRPWLLPYLGCPRGAGGFYQQFVPAVRRFYLGLAGPKVKVPAIFPDLGAMVTIDWCIRIPLCFFLIN